MTETYAATVAAVVPVLWLVGAVEQHQLAKANAQHSLDTATVVAKNRQELAALDTEASIAQFDAVVANLPHIPGDRDAKLKATVNIIWAVVVGALLPSEIVSLSWLAEPVQEPQRFWAHYCLWSILLGFITVGSLPVVISFWTYRKAASDIRANIQAFREDRNRLTSRLRERMEEIGRRADTARTAEDIEEIRRLLRELEGESPRGAGQ
ncbi:hypothetical protein [Streptomyces decoyicus]|uniref:hypothetical protein n=1 Tax=Streptomyces decoyicus TaxID=249567 RepID=UPI00386A16A8